MEDFENQRNTQQTLLDEAALRRKEQQEKLDNLREEIRICMEKIDAGKMS